MRMKSSILNVATNIFILFTKTILSFITRTIFIKILGKEMLGLDGLCISLLSMLSLAELGIATSINFSLYKPLADGDVKKISAIMSLNKKIFTYIGIVIFILGICLMPLLHLFVKGYSYDNLYLIFVLYLIDCSTSYFITYKESIIISDQKGYKLGIFDTIFSILLYGFQIITLFITKNFVLYLLSSIIIKMIQNIVKNIYITKLYKNIDFNSKEKVDKKTVAGIKKNVGALLFHRIGGYLLNGTDNIIISSINIGLVGIYSNYLSVICIMQTFTNSIYNGILSSFGNMVVKETKKIQENVFNISNFVCFIVSGFITLELSLLFNPFIEVWIGNAYTLHYWIVIVIVFNFYFYSSMISIDVIKKASGLYNIDKYIPIIQSFVNIIVSVILGKFLGIGGVVLGTLVSYLSVSLIFEPIIIYKTIFGKSPCQYYFKQLKNIIIMITSFLICNIIIANVNLENNIFNIIISGLGIAVVYFLICIICYHKTNEYQYIKSVLLNIRGVKK